VWKDRLRIFQKMKNKDKGRDTTKKLQRSVIDATRQLQLEKRREKSREGSKWEDRKGSAWPPLKEDLAIILLAKTL